MSKAEEKAIEAYPPKLVTYSDLFGEETLDDNGLKRTVFIEGYQQAVKDLELSWEDMRDIYDLAYNLRFPHKKQKEFFEEVLRRFKETKKID